MARARAKGESGADAWTSTSSTSATASGVPGMMDWWAARRNTVALATAPVGGSSPSKTESIRSMQAKSASRGTATSASSWAVCSRSRVEPMRALASFSTASRSRARCRSVMSSTAWQTANTSPERSLSGKTELDQTRSRSGSEGTRPWTSMSAIATPWRSTWAWVASIPEVSTCETVSLRVSPRRSSSATPLSLRSAAFCIRQRYWAS